MCMRVYVYIYIYTYMLLRPTETHPCTLLQILAPMQFDYA